MSKMENRKQEKEVWIETLTYFILKNWCNTIELLFSEVGESNFLKTQFCKITTDRQADILIEFLALYLYYCDYVTYESMGKDQRDTIIDEVIRKIGESLLRGDEQILLEMFEKSPMSYDDFLNCSLTSKFVKEYNIKLSEYSKYETFYSDADHLQGTLIYAIGSRIAALLNCDNQASVIFSIYITVMNQLIAFQKGFKLITKRSEKLEHDN